MRRCAFATLAALATLLAAKEAEVGQLHYQAITLEELVQQSPLIVVARPTGEPETRTVEHGEGIDPYTYLLHRYEVVACLRGKAKPGETLVLSGFDRGAMTRHIAYYARGMSRHPVIASYRSDDPPQDPQAPQILFLQRAVFLQYDAGKKQLVGRDDTYRLAVPGAAENARKQAEVAKLIKKAGGAAERLNITVGVAKKSDALDDRIGDLLRERYKAEGSLSWTIVETRAEKQR